MEQRSIVPTNLPWPTQRRSILLSHRNSQASYKMTRELGVLNALRVYRGVES